MSLVSVVRSIHSALPDGSPIRVRPACADDKAATRRFLERLSPHSLGLRFCGIPDLDGAASCLVDAEYPDSLALVIETAGSGEIIAHGSYARTDSRRAEIALLVEDRWQGCGLARILVAQLGAIARRHGIEWFVAEVLPSNHRVLTALHNYSKPVTMRHSWGGVEIELPTGPRPRGFAQPLRTAA